MTYEEYVRMVRLVLGHTLPRLEIMTERMAEKLGVVFEQPSFLPKDQSKPGSCWIRACSKVSDSRKSFCMTCESDGRAALYLVNLVQGGMPIQFTGHAKRSITCPGFGPCYKDHSWP